MKIHVTAAHIRKGKKLDDNSCPIALALRETFGIGKSCVSVPGKNEYEYDQEPIKVGKLQFEYSRSVSRFVKAFDAGKKVAPTTVNLNMKTLKCG